MKKHLRGKRYIRSRASVQIGRNKRQVRKWESFADQLQRLADYLNSIDWKATFENRAKAFNTELNRVLDNSRL